MRRILTACAVTGALTTTVGSAAAHHSAAIYESTTTSLEGTVQEFRYINPHSVLVVKVNAASGGTVVWHLEGESPAMLTRDGWSHAAIAPGDQIKLDINRLRTGGAAGFWNPKAVYYVNGKPFVGSPCLSSPNRCHSP